MKATALDFAGYLAAALLGGLAGWAAFGAILFVYVG